MPKNVHLLTRLFEDFADCYAEWNRKECGAEPRERLNAGDCGTAAIAVGWVWEQLTGKPIAYCDNGQHGFLEYYNWCYDTLQPYGARLQHMLGHYINLPLIRTPDVRTLHYQFLRNDRLGYSWVCEFCGRWGVKPYSLTDFSAGEYRPFEDQKRIESDRAKFAKWKFVPSENPLEHLPVDTPMLIEICTSSIPRKDEVFFGRVLMVKSKRTLVIDGQPVTEHGTILQYLRLDDALMSYQYAQAMY